MARFARSHLERIVSAYSARSCSTVSLCSLALSAGRTRARGRHLCFSASSGSGAPAVQSRAFSDDGRTRRGSIHDQRRPPCFATRELPAEPTVTAPDGSHARELLSLPSVSAAHSELAPGVASRAGRHRTVDEIWYILEGRGEMWRRDGGREEVVSLHRDLCLTIPVGTSFQYRTIGDSPLSAFAVTMPPWPAGTDDEWVEVEAHWPVQERVVGAEVPRLARHSA